MSKTTSFIGEFLGRKVEEKAVSKANGIAGKMAGKIYGKATEKVINSVYNKALERIDDTNNSNLVEGSLEELLARNPENSKLILYPDFRVQDREGKQQYRIDNAVFSSHTWYLYGEKIKKIASVREKHQGWVKRFIWRKTKPKDFVIRLKGRPIGTLHTICKDGKRIGTTDFNDWKIENDQISNGSRCIASYKRVRSFQEIKYVLDYGKYMDESILLLVFFAMQKAD